MTITKETIIVDVLRTYPEAAGLFLEIGMHCLGCPSANAESIEEACETHGQNADELVNKINALIEGN